MTRNMFAVSLLGIAVAACGRSGGGDAASNAALTNASLVETTGSAASIGTYGPSDVSTPRFVQDAATSDMYEIAAAKIALSRSQSAPIKAFAEDMIKAHGATSAELKSLLPKAGVTAPLPTALDPRRARLIEDLERVAPDKFDARYLDQQTGAHREALGLMDSYATHGDNADLKRFAGETKPKIQQHLETASRLDHSGVDKDAKPNTSG